MNSKLNFFLISVFLLVAGVCLNTSCKSSLEKEKKSIAQKQNKVSRDTPAPNMFELLKRQSAVMVQGTEQAPRFLIRGRRTFNTNNDPLFYLNGQNMGHDFSRIAHINPGDVQRIKVVKDPAELVAYGIGASNGVIEVILKQ